MSIFAPSREFPEDVKEQARASYEVQVETLLMLQEIVLHLRLITAEEPLDEDFDRA